MKSDPPRPSHLPSRWLILAWMAWISASGLALGLDFLGVPARFEQLHRVPAPDATSAARQLSQAMVDALPQLGLSIDVYAAYMLGIELALTVVFASIAIVIFWRKPKDRVAILVSFALVIFGATISSITDGLVEKHAVPYWLINTLQALGLASILPIFYIFPDGRFVPRWTRILTVLWVGLLLIWLLFPEVPLNFIYGETADKNRFGSFLLGAAWFASGAFAQIYRYIRVSGPIQRQQTKWIVFGFTAAFLAGGVDYFPPTVPAIYQSGKLSLLSELISTPIASLLLLLLPLSIGFSILRYRLWDIDLIVTLTLVYTLLTGSLGLSYIGSIGLCQWVILRLTQQAQLTDPQRGGVLLVSTLVIAALFGPWRRRLQTFIDRRFYRERVDFQKAFTDF